MIRQIGWFFAAVLFGSQGYAIEALQLDNVPVPIISGCERYFFTSSIPRSGTIYVLPEVLPKSDLFSETRITIIKNHKPENEKYWIMTFEIFFPSDDQGAKANAHIDSYANVSSCNLDLVQDMLNRHRPDNDKIHTIAPMPLTSIEVSIPDFVESVHRIGRPEDAEPDLIQYQGEVFAINLPITHEERDNILATLGRQNGLQAKVRMKFTAARRDGSLNVSFDNDQLATNFRLAVGAGKPGIAKADLEATLRTAWTRTQLNIDSRSSSSEATNQAFKQVLDSVIAQLSSKPMAIPEKIVKEKGEDSLNLIPVDAVVDVIKSSVRSVISVNHTTEPKSASGDVTIRIQAVLGDPNIRMIRVANNETEPTMSERIEAGQTIKITPNIYALVGTQYDEKVSYLTKSDLAHKKYLKFVGDLVTRDGFEVKNQDRNGIMMAIGTHAGATSMFADSGFSMLWTPEVSWKRIERYPVTSSVHRVKMGNKIPDWKRFPVGVSFSMVGAQARMISFMELMRDSKYWKGCYEESTGAVVIKAKKNLGLMMFRSRFLLHENNDRFDLDRKERDKPDLNLEGKACKEIRDFDKKMFCYYPLCKSLPVKCPRVGPPTEGCLDPELYLAEFQRVTSCRDVDYGRVALDLEEIVQMETTFGGKPKLTRYPVVTTGKATLRSRSLYYNVEFVENDDAEIEDCKEINDEGEPMFAAPMTGVKPFIKEVVPAIPQNQKDDVQPPAEPVPPPVAAPSTPSEIDGGQTQVPSPL